MTELYCILFIIIGYLSGSILWSKIIAMTFFSKDIVALNQDRNPGASNVFKTCGVVGGSIALILDIFKGFLPVFLAIRLLPVDNLLFSLILIAPVLGHIHSVFYKFHGGKAIAVSFGVLMAVAFISYTPLAVLAILYVFFSVVIVLRSHLWRSVVVFVLFGLATALFEGNIYITVGCLIISIIVFLRHYISRDKNEPISITLFPRFNKKEKEIK